jgi:hypothetical protein
MRTRAAGAIVAALVLGLAVGCGGDEEGEDEAGGPCPAAPTELAQPPTLPESFPTPEGVVYTGEEDAGPSAIVEGFRDGELEDAFDAYKDAFGDAGYDVTKDEKEEDDAEVNFAGGGTTGQVRLEQRCEDRTSIEITIRPE